MTGKVLLIYIIMISLILSQDCIEPSPNNENICCTGPTRSDDNPPDECLNGVSVLNFDNTGICNENFDCCQCVQINVNNARSFTCGGDSACIGVPMNISGDTLGAVLNCNGDISCFNCNFTGEHITVLRCDGDSSCEEMDGHINELSGITGAALQVTCNGDLSCRTSSMVAVNVGDWRCDGDQSCEDSILNLICQTNGNDVGCNIVGGGDYSLSNAIGNITGAGLLQCGGDAACLNSSLTIQCINGGCNVNCGGPESCSGAIFNIVNANMLECVAPDACSFSNINLECVLPLGCPILCNAFRPCFGSTFNIINSRGLLCGSLGDACSDSTITLINNVISSDSTISCLGVNACKNAIINGGFDSESNEDLPVINIRDISCAGTHACFDADILIECDIDVGCNALCSGDGACSNIRDASELSVIGLYNVKQLTCTGNMAGFPACNGWIELIPFFNDFMLECAQQNSCESGTFLIIIQPDITSIKNILCSAQESCFDSTFTLDVDTPEPFIVSSIMCNGPQSCASFTFDYQSNSELNMDLVQCSGMESCLFSNFFINAATVNINILCNGFSSCVNSTYIIDAETINIGVSCSIVNDINTCDGAFVINNGIQTPLIDFVV